jgi:hypothetical protein
MQAHQEKQKRGLARAGRQFIAALETSKAIFQTQKEKKKSRIRQPVPMCDIASKPPAWRVSSFSCSKLTRQ